MKALHFSRVLPLMALLFCMFFTGQVVAQPIDGIIAIIGEDIILESDVQNQKAYYINAGQKDDGTLKCQIMENMIISKLLYNKAKQDSLEIGDDRVEQELERRITNFLGLYGKEKLEEIYGKSLSEIRQDLRPEIREQLLVEQMRQTILAKAKVTPEDVRKFYRSIPKDSLPYLPAEVELHHIVVKRPFSEKSKADAKEKLDFLRKEIVEGGKDFATIAKTESMGPTKTKGGHLGTFGKGIMDKNFEQVAFGLRPGEVSEPFESQFGMHIVKVHKRLGAKVDASHILIIPERTSEDDDLAIKKLNNIKELIDSDSLTFEQAAIEYSMDNATKSCGGCIQNPQTGETRISMDMLDADFYFKIEKMKPGDISEPLALIDPSGDKTYHIIYFKRQIDPHVANLKDDYQKIQAAALQAKQYETLEKWFDKAKENVYIDIKESECLSSLTNWTQ